MKTVDQISRGAAHFFDTEVRPSLTAQKGILYGMAVGMAAGNAGKIMEQYMPALKILGVVDGSGLVDLQAVASELKRQMRQSSGELRLDIGKDQFIFREADVDKLVEFIERA